MDSAWIGLFGVLGGATITALVALLTTWLNARSRAESERRALAVATADRRRQAFADYLFRALQAYEHVTKQLASEVDPKGPETSRAIDAAFERVGESEEWLEFNRAGTFLYFMLDNEGAAAIERFEATIMRAAARTALRMESPVWNELIQEPLAAMRRALPDD